MVIRRLIVVVLLVLVACGSAPAVIAPTDVPATATRITEVDLTETLEPTAAPPPTETSEPTPTPIAVVAVGQRGALRNQPRSGPATDVYLCPQDQVSILEQVAAENFFWYYVRVVDIGPRCQQDRARPGAEGWTTSRSLGVVSPERAALIPTPPADRVTPTPTKEPTRTPGPTREPKPTAAPATGGGQRIGAICRDGTRSSATGSGACSRHGGVDHWIYR